jgi:hypothetical protein
MTSRVNADYPKILVVDAMPFTRISNSGIMKTNLFKGWPADRLAQIDYSNTKPDFDVCRRYWALSKWEILKGLVGLAGNAEIPLPERAAGGPGTAEDPFAYERRPRIERTLSILPGSVRLLLGEAVFRLPSLLSPPLRKWIDDFHPDLVFSMMANTPMLRTAVEISRWRKIPILPYFTDDWIMTLYKGRVFGRGLRRGLMFWFNQCLERAPVCITICDAMNEEYSRRYRVACETFMNLVDLAGGEGPRPKPDPAEFARLVFLGSLEPGRWRSLRAIGEALADLRSEGFDGELSIYAFPADIKKYGSSLTLEPVMRIAGTASFDRVPALQREADILVHVESFEAAVREYTKFSLSTKIPQYMLSGTCIFGYGPGEVASMRYLADSGAGITVGREDPGLLRAALKGLLTNGDLRRRTAGRAWAVAVERNGAEGQRRRFRETVIRARDAWRER